MIHFCVLRIPSLISKDHKENIICTIDDVRGDFLGPPHGTTPAAVIANKTEILKAVSILMRKVMNNTAVSAT